MDDVLSHRLPWALAMDRRLVILYNASVCCAATSLALIGWSHNLLQDIPFSADMKSRLNNLYEYYEYKAFAAKYGSIRTSLFIMISIWALWKTGLLPRFLWTLDKLFYKLYPARLRGASHGQRGDSPIPPSTLGVTAIIPALYLLVYVSSVYFDTMACYTRYHYGHVLVYEPCEIWGTGTTEYRLCKIASGKLFALQMAGLGFALAPALVLSLHFALTVYQIYTAFAWLNRQLKFIKARRPEIDAELDALEARERSMKGTLDQDHELPVSQRSNGDVRVNDQGANMEENSE